MNGGNAQRETSGMYSALLCVWLPGCEVWRVMWCDMWFGTSLLLHFISLLCFGLVSFWMEELSAELTGSLCGFSINLLFSSLLFFTQMKFSPISLSPSPLLSASHLISLIIRMWASIDHFIIVSIPVPGRFLRMAFNSRFVWEVCLLEISVSVDISINHIEGIHPIDHLISLSRPIPFLFSPCSFSRCHRGRIFTTYISRQKVNQSIINQSKFPLFVSFFASSEELSSVYVHTSTTFNSQNPEKKPSWPYTSTSTTTEGHGRPNGRRAHYTGWREGPRWLTRSDAHDGQVEVSEGLSRRRMNMRAKKSESHNWIRQRRSSDSSWKRSQTAMSPNDRAPSSFRWPPQKKRGQTRSHLRKRWSKTTPKHHSRGRQTTFLRKTHNKENTSYIDTFTNNPADIAQLHQDTLQWSSSQHLIQ